jgi:hypothetical protein
VAAPAGAAADAGDAARVTPPTTIAEVTAHAVRHFHSHILGLICPPPLGAIGKKIPDKQKSNKMLQMAQLCQVA